MPDKVVKSYPQIWCGINAKPLPDKPSAIKQRSWDNPVVKREFAFLLRHQEVDYGVVQLLAAASKHRTDRLHAIPITSCELRLDYGAVRIAVGLCLGACICQPHTCCCGVQVDVRKSHIILSCKRSSGRLIRHNH